MPSTCIIGSIIHTTGLRFHCARLYTFYHSITARALVHTLVFWGVLGACAPSLTCLMFLLTYVVPKRFPIPASRRYSKDSQGGPQQARKGPAANECPNECPVNALGVPWYTMAHDLKPHDIMSTLRV